MGKRGTYDNVIESFTEQEKQLFYRYVRQADDCWIWTGSKSATLEVHPVKVNNKLIYISARRIALILNGEKIPEHSIIVNITKVTNRINCYNGCINPDHLLIALSNRIQFTEEECQNIVDEAFNGFSYLHIAKKHNCTYGTISKIVNGIHMPSNNIVYNNLEKTIS